MCGIGAAGDRDRMHAAYGRIVHLQRAVGSAHQVNVQFVLADDEVRDRLDAAERREGIFDDVGVRTQGDGVGRAGEAYARGVQAGIRAGGVGAKIDRGGLRLS